MNCDLTPLQQAAGFVTLINVAGFFAAVVGVACAGYILFRWCGWMLKFFANIPVLAYELVTYAASLGLIVGAYWVSPANQFWMLFPGCLLVPAALSITGFLRKIEPNELRFATVLFCVWAPLAIFYQSVPVGFLAVMALFAILGFSVWLSPLCYGFGFKEKNGLGRATSAGFVLLALFVGLRLAHTGLPYLGVFQMGCLWMGSFVGYLGLLIASSRWCHESFDYAFMQVITVAAGMGALVLGSLLAIPELSGIGGTFFALYLIEKPCEIPIKSAMGWATFGLMMAGLVGSAAWWAQNHMALVAPYILFS